MCPIWPLHLIIMYVLALCPLWVLCQAIPNMTAKFLTDYIHVEMEGVTLVNVTLNGTGLMEGDEFAVKTSNEDIAAVEWSTYQLIEKEPDKGFWNGQIRVQGKFIGRTDVVLSGKRGQEQFPITNGSHPVTVLRPVRLIDLIFTHSVIAFMSLIFINFGCAMHWPTVKEVLRRPIGPAIAIFGQFLVMPLLSFGLGYIIFPTWPSLRLGMFFTGVSPGGGASNIWTFILGGNLNLSLAITSLSKIASFVLMPAWLFSLGQVVFQNAKIVVPYQRIATLVAGMFVPLLIGLSMQKCTPKAAAFMVRILKGFSTILLLFIIIFAIVTNLYIFKLLSWQIVIAGMGIPWLGYGVGYILARLFKQPQEDALAISIETGIQNTGIAIFLLKYGLEQPDADLTTVVPVSVAIMTPIPMIVIYIYQRIKACLGKNNHEKIVEENVTPLPETPESCCISTVNEGNENYTNSISKM